jgi:hypothetical protein
MIVVGGTMLVRNSLVVAAACIATSASAQIYVLTNDAGKTIIVPPGEKNVDQFIIDKMKGQPGAGWRVTFQTGEKLCVARRSVPSFKQPTRWVTATGATRAEAERNASNEAKAMTNGGPGNWEQGYCNKTAAPLKPIDTDDLHRRALGK